MREFLKGNLTKPTVFFFFFSTLHFHPLLPTRDSFELFRGGPAVEQTGQTLSITVVQGRTATVLEVEHTGVDFATL